MKIKSVIQVERKRIIDLRRINKWPKILLMDRQIEKKDVEFDDFVESLNFTNSSDGNISLRNCNN